MFILSIPLIGAIHWDFKTFPPGVSSQIVDLSDRQKSRIPLYEQSLQVAAESQVPSPMFSNYFVKEGVVTNSHAVPAGNIEYGLCQALHGEESAVAAHRSRINSSAEDKDLVLGILTAESPELIVGPCGNCRDTMIDGFGTDFEIVEGAPDGGRAFVVPMKKYMFEPQDDIAFAAASELDAAHQLGMGKLAFQEVVSESIAEGKRLTNDAYSPKGINPERRYYAILVTANNLIHGAHDVMVDYHPIYALRDAIRQARREGDTDLRSVFVVAEDSGIKMPQVMYKDRQHLLEFNLQGELIRGDEQDTPVFLVGHDDKGVVTNVRKTSVNEWLPFAFNPRAFGNEFLEFLGEYHKSKIQ